MDPAARPGSIASRLAATTRVLSVEDDPDIAEFLRAYFRASGYDLLHIDPSSPAEVVEALDIHRPDCVLLDISLRGFNGFEAYELIRAERRFDQTPIIVVSANATVKMYADQLERGGADGLVTKPFNARTLAGVVASHIAAARAATAPLSSSALVDALDDELATAAAAGESVSFALLQLRARAGIASSVGPEGLAFVMREVVRRTRECVPEGAILGGGEGDDLAVVLPRVSPADAVPIVEAVIASAGGLVALPGGTDVVAELAAGVAAFPDHASNGDELYMAADAALADAVDAGRTVALAI